MLSFKKVLISAIFVGNISIVHGIKLPQDPSRIVKRAQPLLKAKSKKNKPLEFQHFCASEEPKSSQAVEKYPEFEQRKKMKK